MTLYSEDFSEFKYTMRGVLRDVQNLIYNKGFESEEIAVVVIADGLDKIKVDAFLQKMEDHNLYREDELRSRFYKRDYVKKTVKGGDGCLHYVTNKHLFEGKRDHYRRNRHDNVMHCFCHGNLTDLSFS